MDNQEKATEQPSELPTTTKKILTDEQLKQD